MTLRPSFLRASLGLFLLMAAVLTVFYYAGTYQDELLGWMRAHWNTIESFRANRPFLTFLALMLLHFVIVACFIPASVVPTLAAGALFGVWGGLGLISLANTLGAIVSFLAARHLFRARVERRYGEALAGLRGAVREDGWFYVALLRLTPLFPATAVNLMMGVLPVRLRAFALATLLASMPVMGFYVWMGTQLHSISTLGELLNARVLGACAVMILFLFAMKYALHRSNASKMPEGPNQ